jgi:hypothetical protein
MGAEPPGKQIQLLFLNDHPARFLSASRADRHIRSHNHPVQLTDPFLQLPHPVNRYGPFGSIPRILGPQVNFDQEHRRDAPEF